MPMVAAVGEFVVCVSGRQTVDGDTVSGGFLLVCLTTYTSIYVSILNPPDLVWYFYATTFSPSKLESKKSLTNGYAVDSSYLVPSHRRFMVGRFVPLFS
jgi:hypothetical protein